MTDEARRKILRLSELTIPREKLLHGRESLAKKRPEIAAQWHPTKNGDFTPDELPSSSSVWVWWKCPKGHEWENSINGRKTDACPICLNRYVVSGQNDLATTHPEIAKQWHPTKNGELTPQHVHAGSHVRAHWVGPCGHEWDTTVAARMRNTAGGCPVCNGKQVLQGFNDLATRHPELAAELHPVKSAHIDPTKIVSGDYKVWWQCKHGHEWEATIGARIRGTGCPNCRRQTSWNEQALGYYISKIYPDTASRSKIDGVEADIHIITQNLVFEYDGEKWHTVERIDGDIAKYYHMQQKNVVLIRVREPKCPDLPNYPGKVFKMASRKPADVNAVIFEVLQYLQSMDPTITIPDVNIERDAHEISARLGIQDYENSIEFRYPEIADEWDYDKNYPLTPDMITAGSPKKVWWICPLGHSYHADPHHRINGKGCPICAGRKVLAGFNDVESQRPDLMPFWNYKRNGTLLPSQVTKGSGKKVWWTCSCGTEFQASVSATSGRCPVCANNKVSPGENDFATEHPELLQFWDYQNNVDIQPNQLKSQSTKVVHWVCEHGHPYERSIAGQVKVQGKCPVCNRTLVLAGVNDFAATHPEVAKWWHPTKNSKTASEVFSGSPGMRWWMCPDGHEYQRTIPGQIKHSYCPECKRLRYAVYAISITDPNDRKRFASGLDAEHALGRKRHNIVEAIKKRRPIAGYLCSYHRFLSRDEYDDVLKAWRTRPDKPNDVMPALPREESFAAQCPDLLKEWAEDMNQGLNPWELRCTSKQQVWWRCPICGETWQTRLTTRAYSQKGTCPACRKIPAYAVSVVDFSDQKQFDSAISAANETGIPYKSIMRCCKHVGSMTYGYLWSHIPFDEKRYQELVAQIPTNQMTVAKRYLGLA